MEGNIVKPAPAKGRKPYALPHSIIGQAVRMSMHCSGIEGSQAFQTEYNRISTSSTADYGTWVSCIRKTVS